MPLSRCIKNSPTNCRSYCTLFRLLITLERSWKDESYQVYLPPIHPTDCKLQTNKMIVLAMNVRTGYSNQKRLTIIGTMKSHRETTIESDR